MFTDQRVQEKHIALGQTQTDRHIGSSTVVRVHRATSDNAVTVQSTTDRAGNTAVMCVRRLYIRLVSRRFAAAKGVSSLSVFR